MSDQLGIKEELAQLRRENTRLRAALEAQEAAQGPVRILPLLPENRAILPSKLEMRELFDAVLEHWPRDFTAVEPDMFARAFRALSMIHRQEILDTSHYVYHWLTIARERGRGDIDLPSFLAAACAWSDVEMVDFRLEDEGVLPAFALNEYCGRLPCDQWRSTLAGKFVTPIDPRPKQRVGDGRTPRPSILIDGKQLPDEQRFVGPRYWGEL